MDIFWVPSREKFIFYFLVRFEIKAYSFYLNFLQTV